MRVSTRSTVRFARLTLLIALVAGPATANEPIIELIPGDAASGDALGNSTAVSGTIAIVGAHQDDDNGTHSGSAYLFDVTTGQELHKLLPDDDNGNGSGSAYLFDVTTGTELFKLTPNDAAANDVFGNSVAIDGNLVIVGAPSKNSAQGAAYLFDATTGLQLDKLTPNSPQTNSWFGRAVGVSGNRAIVGAPFASFGILDRGLAFLFDTGTGNQLFQLLATDGASFDRFGGSAAISGGKALVGASDHGVFGALSGAAYVYDVATGQLDSKLTSTDAAAGELFGHSLALSGERAVIGSVAGFGGVINSGTAHAFPLTGKVWQNLGGGSVGVDGVPSLLGIGDLAPDSDLCLALNRAEPNSPIFLLLGFSAIYAPAKGGTVVPNPDFIFTGFGTDANGQFILPTTFPPGAPSGVPLFMQIWVQDSFGFYPLAASNGILQSTP
jgi:hypothetical protein